MRWVDGRSLEQCCPVCGMLGTKRVRLEVESPFPGRGMRSLLDCPSCTSQFFADQTPPPDTYEDDRASVKFYIEQAASIELMISPLLRVPAERGARLIDVGCGFGFALDFARAVLGWKARGIDRSTAAETGARLLDVDITLADFDGPESVGGETFDVVLGAEVIEHMADPHGFIRSVAAILEPRGIAILTTPNAAAIRRERPVSEILRILSPGFHHVFFTAESLRALLEQGGFAHVHVEAEGDSLRAYASRVPLDLVASVKIDDRAYRTYLSERGNARDLDVDLRIGLKYRHFKALVNTGAWQDARTEFGALRAVVKQRYGFDIGAPYTIPVLDPVPIDLALDHRQANVYFEQFTSRMPGNIVGVLYFRGALALGTGVSDEAVEFFRAVGSIGIAVRSLRLTMANSDGETTDLFRRSFLLRALALTDLDPDDSLREIDRILDDKPPPGVPHAFWDFSASDREWLLGAAFLRLVDRGHAAAGEIVFGRLCSRFLADYGLDLTRPESVMRVATAPVDGLADVSRRGGGTASRAQSADVAPVLFARGLLDLNAGRASEALRYFRTVIALLPEPTDLSSELTGASHNRAALLTRTRVHAALAVAAIDPERALVELQSVLESASPGVGPALWQNAGADRMRIVGSVFVSLVNRGNHALAARLAGEVEAALTTAQDGAPDPAVLAAGADVALEAAFCRAMLALNHECDYGRAARWFHSVYEAAYARARGEDNSPSVRALFWTARYHEALAAVQADDLERAVSIVEEMETPPPGVSPALWQGFGSDRLQKLGGIFVRLVNRGNGELAARLASGIESALGGAHDEAPDLTVQVAGADVALEAAFCRAMLALNHERDYGRAVRWFHSVYEAAYARARRDDPSPSTRTLLWPARYHEALALVQANDLSAALSTVESMETPPPGVPPALWRALGADRMRVIGSIFVRLVNQGSGAGAARLVAEVEAAFGVAPGEAPDPAALAAGSDLELDAVFCRAMLALNHQRTPERAASWFHSAYEAACERWRSATASPSAQALLWTARYHEALALARAGNPHRAALIAEQITSDHATTQPPVPPSLADAACPLLAPRPAERQPPSSQGR
jgi:2-polyprenyl-3-methyl-5-hydroxy-6-metoxy-1,4-benzoquinol methylase